MFSLPSIPGHSIQNRQRSVSPTFKCKMAFVTKISRLFPFKLGRSFFEERIHSFFVIMCSTGLIL